MGRYRVLVAEDHKTWQDEFTEALGEFGPDVEHVVVGTSLAALDHLRETPFDIVLLDLGLPVADGGSRAEVDAGMEVAQALRGSSLNRRAALMVVTGSGTLDLAIRVFQDFDCSQFIRKEHYDREVFQAQIRQAFRLVRLSQADERQDSRRIVDVLLDPTGGGGSSLREPWCSLARRADNLDHLIRSGGAELWRPEARNLGKQLFDALDKVTSLRSRLAAARASAPAGRDVWIRITGPVESVQLPFELIRDQKDYVALRHVILRRDATVAEARARQPRGFSHFVRSLVDSGHDLRILLVAANADGAIPSVDTEVEALESVLNRGLRLLGIRHRITALPSGEATYARVEEELGSGRHHVFHFAGHGRFGGAIPEAGGLVLRDDGGLRTLRADALNILTSDSELCLVFLSCCLGARTAGDPGRGDFAGVVEAFVRAGVPDVVGYRWTVADEGARRLAEAFYSELLDSFSPAAALFRARQAIVLEVDRDDETWASAICTSQSG